MTQPMRILIDSVDRTLLSFRVSLHCEKGRPLKSAQIMQPVDNHIDSFYRTLLFFRVSLHCERGRTLK